MASTTDPLKREPEEEEGAPETAAADDEDTGAPSPSSGYKKSPLLRAKKTKTCFSIFTPSISVQEHTGNEKSCVWHATDYADGELKEELFCIRFPSIENCKSFKETMEEVAESQVKSTKEQGEEADSAANLLGNLTVKEGKDQEEKSEAAAPLATEEKAAIAKSEDKSNE